MEWSLTIIALFAGNPREQRWARKQLSTGIKYTSVSSSTRPTSFPTPPAVASAPVPELPASRLGRPNLNLHRASSTFLNSPTPFEDRTYGKYRWLAQWYKTIWTCCSSIVCFRSPRDASCCTWPPGWETPAARRVGQTVGRNHINGGPRCTNCGGGGQPCCHDLTRRWDRWGGCRECCGRHGLYGSGR